MKIARLDSRCGESHIYSIYCEGCGEGRQLFNRSGKLEDKDIRYLKCWACDKTSEEIDKESEVPPYGLRHSALRELYTTYGDNREVVKILNQLNKVMK